MRFFLLSVSLLLTAVFLVPLSQAQKDCIFPDYSVVVRVENDGYISTGRGAKVCGGYVLTAAHIFPETYLPGDRCTVAHIDGETSVETILSIDRGLDYAVLTGDIAIGATIGRPTKNVLFKKSDETAFKKYALSVVRFDGKTYYSIIADLQKGESGAPVYDDSGAVIGIILSKERDGDRVCVLPCEYVLLP